VRPLCAFFVGTIASRLQSLGLAVEKIAAVHGRTGTMAELREAIEKFKALK
jgi:hypothetical protein